MGTVGLTDGPVVAIVPAAGRSERFGAAKVIAAFRGEPLLTHTLRSLIDAGVPRVIVVTAPAMDLQAVPLIAHEGIRTIVNPDPSRGMFSSIRAGLTDAEAARAGVILVLPADMPFVRSTTVSALVAACREVGQPVVPAYQARHGHPLAIPGRLLPALLAADEGHSLKDALASALGPPREIEIDDPGVVRDVDRPADLDGIPSG